jgi:hypothetical protein
MRHRDQIIVKPERRRKVGEKVMVIQLAEPAGEELNKVETGILERL